MASVKEEQGENVPVYDEWCNNQWNMQMGGKCFDLTPHQS